MRPEVAQRVVPVQGALLLDTGASSTCIAQHAAAALGLIPLRLAKGYGAGGEHQNPIYLAQLSISVNEGKIETTYTLQLEAQGIPEMERMIPDGQLTYAGQSVRLIGLLGRDFLAHCRFKYDGPEGQLRLQIDVDKLRASRPAPGNAAT